MLARREVSSCLEHSAGAPAQTNLRHSLNPLPLFFTRKIVGYGATGGFLIAALWVGGNLSGPALDCPTQGNGGESFRDDQNVTTARQSKKEQVIQRVIDEGVEPAEARRRVQAFCLGRRSNSSVKSITHQLPKNCYFT